jgi:hypothetical protein
LNLRFRLYHLNRLHLMCLKSPQNLMYLKNPRYHSFLKNL